MNLYSYISRLISKIRYKIFRLISLLLLGREGGQSIVGQCVSIDLEFANTEFVRKRILDRKFLSNAVVQEYNLKNVPECWKTLFSRVALFSRRYAYILKDVVVGPDSGVIYVSPKKFCSGDGLVFIQSVCNHYFFFQSGIQEVMRSAKVTNIEFPVCPMPVIGYYHEMFEGLLHVMKARMILGNIKVLVSSRRPRYIDEMLGFIGVDSGDVVYSNSPLHVKKAVLIPRWSDCGENLKDDVCEFRDYLVSRLPQNITGAKKLYISRAKSRRSLPDEKGIEKILKGKGFEVAYFEDMSFVEQLKSIRAAEVIVSPHGAGLSNIIVAKPGAKVVEIMTQGWANNCYGHLSASLDLDYTCIDADEGSFMDWVENLDLYTISCPEKVGVHCAAGV